MSATLHRTEGSDDRFERAIQWLRDNYQDHNIASLCDGLRAVYGSVAPDGWQLIETAPKDGSAVLAFWGTEAEAEITARRYGITRWSGGTWLSVDDPDDEYIDPAFWMPLPLPPAPNQGEAS